MTEQALKSVHIKNELVEKIHISKKNALTLNQQKLILYLASLIDETTEVIKTIDLSIADYFKILGVSYSSASKELLEKSLLSLGAKCFFLPDQAGDYKVLCRWLDVVEIDYNKNILHLRLSDTLEPYFLNLTKQARTIFQLGYVLQFRKSHSIELYLYACRFKNLNFPIMIKIDEALKRFGNGKYKRHSLLMNHVINPAVNEINEKSDLLISVESIFDGKKVSHICFYITRKIGCEKQVADEWKKQFNKPKLNSMVRESFRDEIIADAQKHKILSEDLDFDDPELCEFDIDDYLKWESGYYESYKKRNS